jgi:2,3-bisphosphoglycerate-independent phosphoglycerate mutase
MPRPKPVMLLILDGWGIYPPGPGNAVHLARTPHLDRLLEDYPHTRLQTSGRAVGLPEGVMGNSEVGHMNIGAGRVVYQDLTRIDMAIETGAFFENPAFLDAVRQVLEKKSALHLIGLLSDGGVHSQLTHLLALLDLAKARGLSEVYVHVILDGRDTSPDGGLSYVAQVQSHIRKIGIGAIASICGRYYAMDRDTRWERTEKAYRLLTLGEGRLEEDPLVGVQRAYERGESDEFVQPIVIAGENDRPVALIGDGDALIFFNFRADRTRQLTRAFTDPGFTGFERTVVPRLSPYVCMTMYDATFGLPVAFPPERLQAILGETVSRQGMRQLRIAETEKYAHVTYFFNGGEEMPFENEERCLIPSPRDVPTYDHKPEMSAIAVADEVLDRITSNRYDMIVLNFANMDMVGHTGVIEAAVIACETVDRCTGRIVEAVLAAGGALLITADHGNAETMRNNDGKMHTAHTTNPVHLILVDEQHRKAELREGILGDIAPTILRLMQIPQPPQMTGKSLID